MTAPANANDGDDDNQKVAIERFELASTALGILDVDSASTQPGWSFNGWVGLENDPLTRYHLPASGQTAYLHRESNGRGGKPVTLVKNLKLSAEDLKSLAKKLKQECGTGGTVKDGIIEIQGEQRERIAEVLKALGYKVKIAGG